MKWAQFLHFYQPAEQQEDILEAVVAQCYRPLFTHFRDDAHVRLTLNVTGSLLELFDQHGYTDLIDMLKEAGKRGHIEFTGSAKYHAFLPFLDSEEIERQIRINDDTNKFYLGEAYQPKGFFPPEMAYTEKLVPILESLGFSWIILDEIAYAGKPEVVTYDKLYKIKNSSLNVFFKERRVSNVLMSAVVRSPETFKEAVREEITTNNYLITGMDGETFGHHRPGLENMLFDIFGSPDFEFVKISDLLNAYPQTEEVVPLLSTWATSPYDIEHGHQFLSWSDPDNEIHKMQWRLLHIALTTIRAMSKNDPTYEHARARMDIATASDHFWWASAKPWWSLEMIEDGAFKLMETIRAIPNLSKDILTEASNLYEGIVSTAFEWQRTGKIRHMMQEQKAILRIPFKDRTVGKGGAEEGVFHAFIDMMNRLEKEASDRGEYEKAILWRDAKFKLEHKLDIYDTVSAIDLVRVEIPHEEVEKIIEQYKDQYQKLRGGQPEQRGA